ncbi:hypothetical protein FHX03_004147 [Rhizobium sp. BK456]|nr:hypothetical protein [Rhizobium sp. BK456]
MPNRAPIQIPFNFNWLNIKANTSLTLFNCLLIKLYAPVILMGQYVNDFT